MSTTRWSQAFRPPIKPSRRSWARIFDKRVIPDLRRDPLSATPPTPLSKKGDIIKVQKEGPMIYVHHRARLGKIRSRLLATIMVPLSLSLKITSMDCTTHPEGRPMATSR
ncbi:hypothetical protein PoB_005413500 [Plakobranchus ocellatus]|uniref:Uncharacterized protein n=1 Tax=Plakobranchus ocellatus TaxID=259542 RepID=A0AAV4C8A3_9GAST|nr:hypothetical protein PoB_005413500 [Plakobranchus ocellatus]